MTSSLGLFEGGEVLSNEHFQEAEEDLGPEAAGLGLDHPADRFLGKEFLLWLWWASENQFGTLSVEGMGPIDVWIDDRIQFRTPGDDPQIADLRGGAPATTAEARMAIPAGKTVESARIGIRIAEREYVLGLHAEGLEWSGAKLPNDGNHSSEEQVRERMFLLEELSALLDGLFLQFVGLRLADSWNTETLPAIRQWVGG